MALGRAADQPDAHCRDQRAERGAAKRERACKRERGQRAAPDEGTVTGAPGGCCASVRRATYAPADAAGQRRPARQTQPGPSFGTRQPKEWAAPGILAMLSPGWPAYGHSMHSDTLAERLVRVRRRIESDVPYSPDWAAAVEELEELEAALATRPAAIVTMDPPPGPPTEATAA